MSEQTSNAPGELQRLRDAVERMDGLSQEAFFWVASLARLAGHALESPDGAKRKEDLTFALSAIFSQARIYEGEINSTATKVGCSAGMDRRRLYSLWDDKNSSSGVSKQSGSPAAL